MKKTEKICPIFRHALLPDVMKRKPDDMYRYSLCKEEKCAWWVDDEVPKCGILNICTNSVNK